jgi:hypothetical protein
MTIAAPGWPQRGPTQDQKQGPGELKPQVRTGAPPGTRTPNPRIKSPLLRSSIPSIYQHLYTTTLARYPQPAEAEYRLRTTGAGWYRDVRANTEQTRIPVGLDQYEGDHPPSPGRALPAVRNAGPEVASAMDTIRDLAWIANAAGRREMDLPYTCGVRQTTPAGRRHRRWGPPGPQGGGDADMPVPDGHLLSDDVAGQTA